jgi:hypothetical protein
MIVSSPKRMTFSLDGEWSFQFGAEAPQSILVPAPWEVQRPDLRGKAGTALYGRTFTVPEEYAGKRALIRFGAVDYFAEVWINDVLVGTHEGGYTPFAFPIDHALIPFAPDAVQTVRVRVTDSTKENDATLPDGTLLKFGEIPHGKQSWYTSVGGIWQSVCVEALSATHIVRAAFHPDIDAGTATAQLTLTGLPAVLDPNWQVRLTLTPPSGAEAMQAVELPLEGQAIREGDLWNLTARFDVRDALLWSPETPHLYTVTVTLEEGGTAHDALTTRFGMRKVETRDGRVWLNHRPIFLAGALDQAFYPQTIYTPPSRDYLRDQFVKAKEMGLNLMRCHIKVPTEEYLELCDEIGLLVWYELPNGDRLSTAFRERAWETWQAMWDRDVNHPCIVVLTIINEAWGIDLHDPEQRRWLRDTYHRAKAAFPDWLIVDNSACHPNFHLAADLDDYHVYYSIPDHADEFARWIAAFARRESGTHSNYGDAEYKRTEPVILSEFGNWGLPLLERVLEAEGGEPYWFKTGDGPVRPDKVLERFEAQGLERAYANYDALAVASQEQEWISLKWEIEEMRRHPQLAGYVVTEFTDLNWECNGLLDMGRNPKIFHHRLADVQRQDILIPRPGPRTALWAGERATLALTFSCFSGRSVAGGYVSWEVEETIDRGSGGFDQAVGGFKGSIPVSLDGEEPDFGSYSLGRISLVAPPVEKASKVVLRLILRDAAGTEVTRNTQTLVFMPTALRTFGAGKELRLHAPLHSIESLPATLASLGFELNAGAEAPVIATKWDDELMCWVQAGGKALLLATEPQSFTLAGGLGFGLTDRDDNGYWGDWCSSKIWFDSGLFPTLPDVDRFDFEYKSVVPKYVMTGPLPENILSGIFLGWLHSPAAMVVRLPIGKGQLVITTFDLLSDLGGDPVATALLHDLLAIASGS